MMYNIQDLVIIKNIKSKSELNMKEGRIIHYNDTNQRYTIRIDGLEYNIKEDNLIKVVKYNNDKSREIIRNIINDITDDITDDLKYVNQWFMDKKVKCYVLEEDNKIKCFALLSKMDFDPMKEYNNPYTLNYIYTFPVYRRDNLAYNLLCNIKEKEQLTAFTTDEVSDELFKKSNYVYKDFCFRSL